MSNNLELSEIKIGINQDNNTEAAIEAINNYVNELNKTCDAGGFAEQVYVLFNNNLYVDNLLEYQMNCLALLQTLAKPNVAEVISQELPYSTYDGILEMIGRLNLFAKIMEQDNFKPLIHAYEISQSEGKLSAKELKKIKEYYEAKQSILPITRGH